MKISVVIPAKNEAETIESIISGCWQHANEVIVVDGNSSDNTPQISSKAGARVIKDHGKGKGEAMRLALREAIGDIVVFVDADGSHDHADIPKLITPITEDRVDHVTGSRLLGGSSELHGGFDEFLRLAGSSFITFLINWRYKVRLSDSQNGFRAIRRDVALKLNLKSNKTTIEQEMIMKTLSMGYKIAEVPTHEYARKAGVSKISVFRDWWRYLISLIIGLIPGPKP